MLHAGGQFAGAPEKTHANVVALNQRHFLPQVFAQKLHQKVRLCFRPPPVFHGEGVQRQRIDVQPRASFDRGARRLRSGTMPRGARQVLALRPASVAIHDDRHMPRQPRQVQPGQHLRLFRRDRPESARVGYGYVEIRFRQHRVFPTIPFTPQS